MADADEKAGRGGTAKDAERNGTIWAVVVGLIVLFIIVAAASSAFKTKKKSPPPQVAVNLGTRAVIVPTDDAERTVVVVPCGPGATAPKPSAASLTASGTIGIRLPKGEGTRVVLVPRCAGGKNGKPAKGKLPSAAFVAEPGTPVPALQAGSGASSSSSSSSKSETTKPGSSSSSSGPTAGDPAVASAQVNVPDRSPIRTVIVSPCAESQPKGAGQRILAPSGKSSTAVAPAC